MRRWVMSRDLKILNTVDSRVYEMLLIYLLVKNMPTISLFMGWYKCKIFERDTTYISFNVLTLLWKILINHVYLHHTEGFTKKWSVFVHYVLKLYNTCVGNVHLFRIVVNLMYREYISNNDQNCNLIQQVLSIAIV